MQAVGPAAVLQRIMLAQAPKLRALGNALALLICVAAMLALSSASPLRAPVVAFVAHAQTESGAALSEQDTAAATAARVGIMRVTTALQFAAAMNAGVRHIIVEDHLDLRELPSLPGLPPVLFQIDPKIQSIQVRSLRCLLRLQE
jgi:hypothetical protein